MISLRPLALGALIATTALAAPVPNRSPEGTLRGFPVIVDPESGKTLAHGTHTQWVEGGLLHVKTAFRFDDGRATTEEFTLERGKDLVQRSWSFLETRGNETVRKFEIDFKAGTATGREARREEDEDLEARRSTWCPARPSRAGPSRSRSGTSRPGS